MQVDKIEIGTVIDHIGAGKATKIMKLLGITEGYPHRVAIMLNVPSKKMRTKDILKIEGKIVSEETANLIALVSDSASINIIKEGKILKKYQVQLPQSINAGKCPNPNCITNEQTIRRFKKETDGYRCAYCEMLFKTSEII